MVVVVGSMLDPSDHEVTREMLLPGASIDLRFLAIVKHRSLQNMHFPQPNRASHNGA